MIVYKNKMIIKEQTVVFVINSATIITNKT